MEIITENVIVHPSFSHLLREKKLCRVDLAIESCCGLTLSKFMAQHLFSNVIVLSYSHETGCMVVTGMDPGILIRRGVICPT